MKPRIIFPFTVLLSIAAFGQPIDNLVLRQPTTVNPINTLSFSIPGSRLTLLHEARGEKLILKIPFIAVNGDSVKVNQARVHGTSSSFLRRKSLSIKLNGNLRFGTLPDTFSLGKFYAVSMNMDKNYIRNRTAYNVLGRVGVKVPPHCYMNVVINKASEGLYMIFDPPEQFALQRGGAKVVIRRGYNQTIDGWNYKGISSKDASALKKRFELIYTDIIRQYHGEQLFQKLDEVIDLNGYFSWLAFNHLFQNGDYSDELYLMWNDSMNRFEIIPWDFDDLLHPQPHEGFEKRNAILGDKLIYSSEDALDVAISKDEYVYRKYLLQYQLLLEKLTPAQFSEILNGVYQDVYPYFQRPEIIGQSQYDQGGATNMDRLETDLRDISAYINTRVAIHRTKINALLK